MTNVGQAGVNILAASPNLRCVVRYQSAGSETEIFANPPSSVTATNLSIVFIDRQGTRFVLPFLELANRLEKRAY